MDKVATDAGASRIGLCFDCEYAKRVEAKQSTVYFLCRRSLTDPAFPKYPTLPVRSCSGYVTESRGISGISPVLESQLARLKTQLASVGVLFAGASPERIDRRPASGKWSARENLAHIGRYHEIFLERLRRILAEASPQLARYRAEEDPGWAEWASKPFEEIGSQLTDLRVKLIDEVAGLQASDYARAGIHPAFGEMSLTTWLEFFLVHEAHHLYVILQRLREP